MKDTVPPRKVDRAEEDGAPVRSFLGCDAYRKYSVRVAMDERPRATAPIRREHERGQLRSFLRRVPAGTDVGVEADRQLVLAGR